MKFYIDQIIESKSPQKEIIDYFFEKLEKEASAGVNEVVNYTTSNKIIQLGLVKRTGREYSRNVIGVTICTFLNFSGLKEKKDYIIKKGAGKAVYQLNIEKNKIKELKEKFGTL